jgi:cell division protein FtsI/penicillin-binding protein 2
MKNLFPFLLFIFVVACHPSVKYQNPIEEILYTSQDSLISAILDQKDSYEIQIIYSPISTDSAGQVTINHYSYNRNDSLYFYPASTVKMPVAFLALEYINELKAQYNSGIDMYSSIEFDSIAPPQRAEIIDTCSPSGLPHVAHYIEKIFAISDNNAYNRLYELMGQDYINDKLKEKGIFTNSRIRTRVGVSGFDTESNKYTNPYRLKNATGELLYEQGERFALYSQFAPLLSTAKGQGYYDDDRDSTIMTPFDMGEKNFINLYDLQQSLERIIYPDLFSDKERFNLTDDQYGFLNSTMSKTPRMFPYLADHEEYYDSYVKFFIYGDQKENIPDHIQIFNKVGWAYGYLTDCAYINDTKNDIQFFLSATIQVNANGIFNDGVYEYETIGVPFLAKLGRAVYNHELKSKK